ncbi:hypothetical protein [Streptomyces canus]|uniref:hypothetical protein n=1 Tax=Streptomyces canus TaxID=58343 RepID=UPI002E3412F6|nr:hypothetical protein [Streptomyces canus]
MAESDVSAELAELRRLADAGSADATDELIQLAAEQGNIDELRRLSDSGNATATDQLIELATEQDDMDELRRLADGGEHHRGRAARGTHRRVITSEGIQRRTRLSDEGPVAQDGVGQLPGGPVAPDRSAEADRRSRRLEQPSARQTTRRSRTS